MNNDFRKDLNSGIEYLSGRGKDLRQWYSSQTVPKKILYAFLAVLAFVGIVLLFIFNQMFLKFLTKLSDKWRDMPFGHLVLFALVFFVGFPPLLGFSTLSIFCGMTYGIFEGWVLLASASISGSFASFLVFRYVLKARSEHLLKSNEKFRAFAEILKQDQSLLLLILIRLCPLPYSLSNGALAAIPELSPITYLLASLITCPKMFIHIFIGFQVKDIGDDKNSVTRRVFDGVSLLTTAFASGITTYIIYSKMQEKLRQFHNNPDENVIFGNFDDDNLELDSTEFDDDNFIIDDEQANIRGDSILDDTRGDTVTEPANGKLRDNLKDNSLFDIEDDDFENGNRSYRDY